AARDDLPDQPGREPPAPAAAETAPRRVPDEDAGPIRRGEARHDEAAELDEVPPRAERDEQRAPARAIVVEEHERVATHADVRRHEVAVDEARGVEPGHLGAEAA